MFPKSGMPNLAFVSKPLFWLALCASLSFAILVYPIYVIRPFRYQGSRELALALEITRWTPFLETIFVTVALALLVFSWRQTSVRWRRVLASISALLVVLFGILSRVNIYELMFHPLDRPTFSPASKARLDGREELIAVQLSGAARAYPVRSMSYHHIVNDVVGGLPVVATY